MEIIKDIVLKIAANALSDPKDLRKPFTSWTLETIRQEAIRTGVIESIYWKLTGKLLNTAV